MRRRLFLLALLAAVGAVVAARVWPAHQASGIPRLVLYISIDQMRYDYLPRFAPLYKGGFRTLLDRGAVLTNALDIVFPHRVRGALPARGFYDDPRHTPFADDLVLASSRDSCSTWTSRPSSGAA